MQPATAPLTIALLVDDTGPGIRFIREGVGAFMHRLGGLAEIALISTGGRNTTVVEFTGQLDALYQGVRQLRPVPHQTTGAYLLDGVHDAIGALNKREAERPVIVVLTLEGPEFSNLRADRLLGELMRSAATIHVVALGKPTLKTMTSWNEPPSQSLRENLDENLNRKKFLEDGTAAVGRPVRAGARRLGRPGGDEGAGRRAGGAVCRGLQPPGRVGPAEEDPGRDNPCGDQGPRPDRRHEVAG